MTSQCCCPLWQNTQTEHACFSSLLLPRVFHPSYIALLPVSHLPAAITLSILPFLLPRGGSHELAGVGGDASGTVQLMTSLVPKRIVGIMYPFSTCVVPESFLDFERALCEPSVYYESVLHCALW